MLIDTGASEEVMQNICEILQEARKDTEKPVIIIFGHAHFDHIYQGLVDRRLYDFGNPVYICHRFGAEKLRAGDQVYTLGELVELPIPSFIVDISLFPSQDSERNENFSSLPGFTYRSEQYQVSDTVRLNSERIIFPDGQFITFWETPGHSPDSISIQTGSLMHIGDIPFATGPGVAGIHGWDPAELRNTIERLSYILEKEDIAIICSGHGNAYTTEMMGKTLERLNHDLDGMPELIVFDKSHANVSFRHAIDLIEEAHRIFPVLAGKLMMLRYQLEEIEEYEMVQEMENLIPHEDIDKILADFQSYYSDFLSGNRCGLQVLLKALQTLQKIRSFLPRCDAGHFIDPVLVRRSIRLFSDLMTTIQGSIPKGILTECNPYQIIHDIDEKYSSFSTSDEEILAAADDVNSFRNLLIGRLAESQKHKEIHISYSENSSAFTIYADQERLSDFLSTLFDYYSVYGATNIHVGFLSEDSVIRIAISPEGKDFHPLLPLSHALLRTVQYSGGEIVKMPVIGSDEIVLQFLVQKQHTNTPNPGSVYMP